MERSILEPIDLFGSSTRLPSLCAVQLLCFPDETAHEWCRCIHTPGNLCLPGISGVLGYRSEVGPSCLDSIPRWLCQDSKWELWGTHGKGQVNLCTWPPLRQHRTPQYRLVGGSSRSGLATPSLTMSPSWSYRLCGCFHLYGRVASTCHPTRASQWAL